MKIKIHFLFFSLLLLGCTPKVSNLKIPSSDHIKEEFEVIWSIELQEGFDDDSVRIWVADESLVLDEVVSTHPITSFTGLRIQLLKGKFLGSFISVRKIGSNSVIPLNSKGIDYLKIKFYLFDSRFNNEFNKETVISLNEGKYIGVKKGAKQEGIALFIQQSKIPFLYY